MPLSQRRQRQALKILWHRVGVGIEIGPRGLSIEWREAEVHVRELIGCSLGREPEKRQVEVLWPDHDRRHWSSEARSEAGRSGKNAVEHLAVCRAHTGVNLEWHIVRKVTRIGVESMSTRLQSG